MYACTTLQVLAVASKYVDQMNGVNLSTAIHRIARACQRFKNSADQVRKVQRGWKGGGGVARGPRRVQE